MKGGLALQAAQGLKEREVLDAVDAEQGGGLPGQKFGQKPKLHHAGIRADRGELLGLETDLCQPLVMLG